jgi:hypothetical protein
MNKINNIKKKINIWANLYKFLKIKIIDYENKTSIILFLLKDFKKIEIIYYLNNYFFLKN